MYLIIGDSYILALQNYKNHKNHLVECSAASIRGLVNGKSKTNT